MITKTLSSFLFFCLLSLAHATASELPTFFSYSDQEKTALKSLASQEKITTASLQKWDRVVYDIVHSDTKLDTNPTRLYTYLYNAQREFAFLSKTIQGDFKGTLDPISFSIITLFLPDYAKPKDFQSDPYSEQLTALILPKFKERIERENASTTEFKAPEEYYTKKETSYTAGRYVARWMPWIATPPEAYRPTPPPASNDPEWKKQIEEIKIAQKDMTPEKLNTIDFWKKEGYDKAESGDWRKIANDYLFSHNLSLTKILFVRSQLLTALYDATIVCFNAKYYFSIVRPIVHDPSVHYIIDAPNHPSYPSAHGVDAGAAETILSAYLPENKMEWERLAKEAMISRIWAGIHHPIDNQAGEESGKKVAQAIINATKDVKE